MNTSQVVKPELDNVERSILILREFYVGNVDTYDKQEAYTKIVKLRRDIMDLRKLL